MIHLTNDTLLDYLHGALAPAEDAAVFSHMELCEACRREHDAEVALGEALRSHAAQTEREMPAMLKAAIWSEIRAAQPSRWSRFAASLRPAIALPLAAAVALAVYFGSGSLHGTSAPQIEAAYYLQDHAALNGTVPFSDHNATPADMEASAGLDSQTSIAIEAASYTADAAHR
ncbi:MAG: anti-sigma factor [Candidatus Baltobacteraceae bacterium]